MRAPLRLEALGAVRLLGASGEELAPGQRKPLALLVYLARAAGRPNGGRIRGREELATLFWGERPDEAARRSLRQALFHLRRVVGDALVVEKETVALRAGALDLDASEFEEHVAAGRHAEAVALWRGDFLAGSESAGTAPYRAWVEGERARLRRFLERALEALVDAAAARGDWPAAAAHAERWAAERPDDERPMRRLLEMLALAGRAGEAVASLAEFTARRRADGAETPDELLALGAQLERRARRRRATPSPGSAGLFTPDMVGRASAFADLTAAWDAARRGAAAVVLVEGDAGMGKTRLIEELLRAVERARQPATILRTRAYEAQREQPLATAHDLLLGLRDAPGLLGAPASALADLAQVVPELHEVVRALPAPAREPGAGVASIARVLADVAAEAPVLLCVDDLPDADPESRRMILALARRLAESPVMVLLTSRAGRAELGEELRDLPLLRRIRLKPLAPAEVEAMLASMLTMPAEERRALAQRLSDEGGGSPFDVLETVYSLVDEEILVPEVDGQWHLVASFEGKPLPIPGSVQEAVARRLERLSAAAREALEAAAVLARPVDAALLADVARRPVQVMADGLDELMLRRMVRAVPRSDRVEIAHDVIRRVAYERLPAERRDAMTARVAPTRRSSPVQIPVAELPAVTHGAPFRWRRRHVAGTAAAVLLAAALSVALLVRRHGDAAAAAAAAKPVVLVAAVDESGGDSTTSWMAAALPRLISARLLRADLMDVIPPDRWHVMRLRAGASGDAAMSPSRLLDLGRRAGATWIVRGELAHAAAGLTLRLDVHVRGDDSVRRVTASGRDPLELANDAAVRLLQVANVARPGARLLELETSSVEAYRQFTQAWFAGVEGHADRSVALLDSAVALDSAFAGAVLSRFTAALARDEPRVTTALQQAWKRHGVHASARDRLEWDARSALLAGEHARAESVARELARRYPRDPRGYDLLSELYLLQGRWADAEQVTSASLALDSLAVEAGTGPCASCAAYGRLALARGAAGRWEAAEQAARRWVALQPDVPHSWLGLGVTLGFRQRYEEAERAMRRAVSLGGADRWHHEQLAQLLLSARRFGALDSAIARWRAGPDSSLRATALDLHVALLRERGRLREARREAERAPDAVPPLVLASILASLGDTAAVRAAFRTRINGPLALPVNGSQARGFAWSRAQEADVTGSWADTAHLRALADSIELVGARSYYGRDWRLVHHVRGLLAARAGRYEDAVRELQRARFLPAGWTRTNVELAKAYLALGRPGEAVAVIRDAYTGNHDAMGRYVTRTELDWWMARTLAATGQRDSARVYAAHVRRAWAQADPEVRARAAALP